jgi:AcrR family transcriptional regulator
MASAALALSSKEQIVVTAERLFAEHGIEGVSLRHIGQSAGNANNSAVQYHFGSKDNLIRAIFEYRLPYLTRRRQLLVAERRPASLRAWVECYLIPVIEQAEEPGSWYLTFVTQLHRWDQGQLLDRVPPPARAATEDFFARVRGFLEIPEPIRSNRITQAVATCLHACADREAERARGKPLLPYTVHKSDLLDGIVGFLRAPVSAESVTALESTEQPSRLRIVVP